MLSEELPSCVCGARKYESRGGSFGAGSIEWFGCLTCNRPTLVVFRDGAGALLRPVAAVDKFSQEMLDYCNGPLDVAMRAYGDVVGEVERAVDRAHRDLDFDALGIPRGSVIDFRRRGDEDESGLSPGGSCRSERGLQEAGRLVDRGPDSPAPVRPARRPASE